MKIVLPFFMGNYFAYADTFLFLERFYSPIFLCSSGSCHIYSPERKRDPIPDPGIDPDDRCGILVIISKVDF